MTCAIIALNAMGEKIAERLRLSLPGADVFLLRREDGDPPPPRLLRRHDAIVTPRNDRKRVIYFDNLGELVGRIFPKYRDLVFIMAVGIVVRVLSPHVRDKKSDPAVVVVDEGRRFAISLLSGHEGGANALALQVANACGAQPVVTTASEVLKPLVVGIGAQRGVEKKAVVQAVLKVLAGVGRERAEVKWLATIDLKGNEPGLRAASEELAIPLRIISREAVLGFAGDYHRSSLVRDRIGVEGVCEPCALLAGKNPRLIAPRKSFGGVMVAVAEEGSL
jgi:cobalt-precorrin 5A hydrolase